MFVFGNLWSMLQCVVLSPPEISCLCCCCTMDVQYISSSPRGNCVLIRWCNKVLFQEIETTKDQNNNGNVQFIHEVFTSNNKELNFQPREETRVVRPPTGAISSLHGDLCEKVKSRRKNRIRRLDSYAI
jgi:hypothetical protein